MEFKALKRLFSKSDATNSVIFSALPEYFINEKELKLSNLNLSCINVLAAEIQHTNLLGAKSFLNIERDVSMQMTRFSGILFSDIFHKQCLRYLY